MSKKSEISPFLIAIIILISGCGEDNIIQPEPGPLEGRWVEEYSHTAFFDPEDPVTDSSGNNDYEIPVKSILTFVRDNFNLKIISGELLQKEAAGSYLTRSDTLILNVRYAYYRQKERLYPDYNPHVDFADTNLFYLVNPDSLAVYPLVYYFGDHMSVRISGFLWSYGLFEKPFKNSGVFLRQQ